MRFILVGLCQLFAAHCSMHMDGWMDLPHTCIYTTRRRRPLAYLESQPAAPQAQLLQARPRILPQKHTQTHTHVWERREPTAEEEWSGVME